MCFIWLLHASVYVNQWLIHWLRYKPWTSFMGWLSRDVTVKKYIHERYSLMPSDSYRGKCLENQNFSDWSIVFLEHFFVKTHGQRVHTYHVYGGEKTTLGSWFFPDSVSRRTHFRRSPPPTAGWSSVGRLVTHDLSPAAPSCQLPNVLQLQPLISLVPLVSGLLTPWLLPSASKHQSYFVQIAVAVISWV